MQGMQARICFKGNLFEEMGVENSARQSCCMAPVIFKLYTYLKIKCCCSVVKEIVGVGVTPFSTNTMTSFSKLAFYVVLLSNVV